jgi:hypothetical protein
MCGEPIKGSVNLKAVILTTSKNYFIVIHFSLLNLQLEPSGPNYAKTRLIIERKTGIITEEGIIKGSIMNN